VKLKEGGSSWQDAQVALSTLRFAEITPSRFAPGFLAHALNNDPKSTVLLAK
jgi:hypothetical protein